LRIRDYTIKVANKQNRYHIRKIADFEYANPVEQISLMYISSYIWFDKNILATKGFIAPQEWIEEFLSKKALKEWATEYQKIISTPIPKNLFILLEAKTKKEQIKSLKDLSLSNDELIAFIFKAYEKYGFKYSQYKATHNHKGLDETKLPSAIHIEDDGTISTIGSTNLSKGEQRQVIEHRKVTVSKFLDNKDIWHCFFLTFKSFGGKENYKNGQPHLHYISNKWGINREEVLSQLTSKDYSLPSLPHIDFHTHRNPKLNSKSSNK
jgi:hypothetical protein